jgi:ABC-2 type transport system ATP-binding protein
MRQRIVLISAIMHNPELLVLDEPFTGLDTTTTLVARNVVELLARNGKAIFFSSPVLEVMERLCTHLVVLKMGRAIAAGTTDEIRGSFARGDLEQAFLQLTDHVDAGQVARKISQIVLDRAG